VSTKGRIKQSLAYWCFSATHVKWDIRRVCETARELGCAGVELASPEDWPLVRSYGLEMPLAHNGMADPVFAKGLNNPRYQEEVIVTTKAMIDRCAEHSIPNVIAFTGYKWRDADDPTSGEISREEGAANTVRGLRELASYAGARNVTVVMEQLNTRDDTHPMKGHPGYQGDDMDYCAAIIREVGSPRAKLLFDIYHCAIMNGDVIRRLRQYADLLGHIHVAGVPGRAEIDDTQEIQFRAVMQTLVEVGYTGFVGQEFIPTRDARQSLAEAVALCDV
jgi:hydroxypyruvate isomerase